MPIDVTRRRWLAWGLFSPLLLLVGRGARAEPFWQCRIPECHQVYDPAEGDPEHGIPPGTPFEALPNDWVCPNCRSPKSYYELRGK